jgi:hypothetical protein
MDSDLVVFFVHVYTKHRTSVFPEFQRQLTAYSLSSSGDLTNIMIQFQIWIYFHKSCVNAWMYCSKFHTLFPVQCLRISGM